ncbi:hypothetical protein [Paenibacillus phytohabitans]|uniref:hypothetical protein n=1 Tax=Paenibacillus phytohabitans TaxID=2654978 RepID=UPI00300B4FF2
MLLIVSGCALKTKEEAKPKSVSVPADEMISIPWNEGWSLAISITPGIPVELRGNDEVMYEISGDMSYLCVKSEGKLESMSKGGNSKKAGGRFYWNPFFGDSQVQPADIGTSWIRIVRMQEGYTTGFVLIKILSSPITTADGGGGMTFKADIIASLEFPRQEGVYQTISDENLKEIESATK